LLCASPCVPLSTKKRLLPQSLCACTHGRIARLRAHALEYVFDIRAYVHSHIIRLTTLCGVACA
jgi:hypothetical protein